MSMPRSGTDWLANLISNVCDFSYSREYFNTESRIDCAERKANIEELRKCFGSPIYWQNIAKKQDEQTEIVFKNTWEKCNIKFNKEVFAFNNIPLFSKYTDVFVLYRDRYQTFPGVSNYRKTEICYDRIYASLELHGYVKSEKNINKRCYVAHAVASCLLLEDAVRLKLPIIKYGKLFKTDMSVVKEISKLPFNCTGLSEAIIENRNYKDRLGFPEHEDIYRKMVEMTTECKITKNIIFGIPFL